MRSLNGEVGRARITDLHQNTLPVLVKLNLERMHQLRRHAIDYLHKRLPSTLPRAARVREFRHKRGAEFHHTAVGKLLCIQNLCAGLTIS